jgi:hypothetical protein
VTGVALALPRAEALTDALMAEGADVIGADGMVSLRTRLGTELASAVEDSPEGERLRLDAFLLGRAGRDPDHFGVADEPFVASARNCRRAVGLGAVARCLGRPSLPPAPAVGDVLGMGVRAVEAGPDAGVPLPWWAAWYTGLPPAGRSMVEAEAVTWATQVWTSLSWQRLARPVVGGADDWWECPGTRVVTLRGHADVRVRPPGRPAFLVVGSEVPAGNWRLPLAFPALVSALVRGPSAVPSRVIGLWPASGQVRILPVDLALLENTADAVLSTVAAWVAARRAEIRRRATPSTPGGVPAASR